MRLLTHNSLCNNAADAKGKGFPLRISATEIKVTEDGLFDERRAAYIRGVIPSLEWGALVKAAAELGISTLPQTLTEELANDAEFIRALYHVLMNVNLVQGMLTCPVTGREFPVTDGIPNMVIEEEDCETVRY